MHMTFYQNGLFGDISIYYPGVKGVEALNYNQTYEIYPRPIRWTVTRVGPST